MMSEKYKVTMRVYDDTSTECALEEAAPDEYTHHKKVKAYDEYVDVFDTKDEAEEFYLECLDDDA